MVFVGKSIVSRSAFYCALVTSCLTIVVFVALFQVQRSIYEKRLVKDSEEGIRRISQTFLGYFYAQGNWVYLEDQQKAFNLTQNVLYNYIVNSHGVIEIGLDGIQSPDVGQMKLPWEPPIPDSSDEKGITVEFNSDARLARKYPERIHVGEKVVLISSPIMCLTTREVCGHLRTAVIFESIAGTLRQLRATLILSGILLTLFTTSLIVFTLRKFLAPLRVISQRMRDLAGEISSGQIPTLNVMAPTDGDLKNEIEETRVFRESLQQFTTAFQRTSSLESELKITRSLSDLAAQVAHDIRSPLAAMEVVSSNLSELPEERRIMLRSALTRIRDIANNLINDYQPRQKLPSELTEAAGEGGEHETSTCLLVSLVDDLLSEKRVQFRSRIGIQIEGRFDSRSYGLFVKANAIVLKRVLSNIVNNAVEAIDTKGEVTLFMEADERFARLRVCDTGKGIPEEILPHLMRKGFSFGKENGVGLGLYFAKVTLEAWGGKIQIQSTGCGTEVVLTLPRMAPPAWFIASLDLKEGQSVVVVDDDNSIHQVWQGRFDSFRRHGVQVTHFSSPDQLSKWVRSIPGEQVKQTLFLVDYEFIASSKNGLEIIEELGLASYAVLVTSRFEETNVLRNCLSLNVRLVPKAQAGFVPVRLVETPLTSHCDVVLIDDDPLVRDAWAAVLRRRNKKLITFESSQAFLAAIDSITKDCPIFIDSSLGEEEPGEIFAKKLFERGFEKLYLATGYPASSFGPMEWLKGIVSKEPPAWL